MRTILHKLFIPHRLIILITILLLSFLTAKSQSINSYNYKTAVGIRGGFAPGITVKHFIGNKTAIEGILNPGYRSFSVTGLFEIHAPAFGLNGMQWFYGGGGHLAETRQDEFYLKKGDRYYYRYQNGGAAIGIDGIIGLEYKIFPVPLSISIDLKPNFEFTAGGYYGYFLDPGIELKFTF